MIVKLSGVGFQPAGREILRDLEWSIARRARCALVGANGAGKSSLLRLVAGELEPDAGEVQRERGLRVRLLPQEVELAPGPTRETLLDAAMRLPPELASVEAELARIEAKLGEPAVQGDERALTRALAAQDDALERRRALGGETHASRVRELLAHFGFGPSDHGRPVGTLSGGERKLVALVALAVSPPGLLALDEPDNHLDLVAKGRLEALIRDYPGAVVLVSHDRYLLDAVVDEIGELAGGRIERYAGGYSAYVAERELRRLRRKKLHADQRKEISRIEASIRRFELWASLVASERHMKQARSRRKRLERMEASGELVEEVRDDRRIRLQIEGGRGSRKALELRGLAVAIDGDLVFDGVDLLVRHGERVGLVGPNGCGKSVLLRAIVGELEPFEGEVVLGPSTRPAYYAQQHETLAGWLDRTPIDWVRDAGPMEEGAAVSLLLRFLFRYEQLRQPIRAFSGGERSRLQLARIMLQKPNLLLLDEPTNNLDIASVEVLEQVLDAFDGSVLVASHDRYFLDQTVDRIAAFEGGRLETHPGGHTDYVEARRRR